MQVGAGGLAGAALPVGVGTVDAHEFTQADADGSAIGGGDAYPDTVTASDADSVVSTDAGLVDALGAASSGDVVFVEGGATIDLTGHENVSIPDGVTLASDRGVDGAPGGEVVIDSFEGDPLFVAYGGARVTGLRIRGPHVGWLDRDSGEYISYGIQVAESDVEIDNVRIRGFTIVAIQVQAANTHVHHNTITDNAGDGYGYGVQVTGGDALIEFNYFERNRHSTVTYDDDYTARYNVHGPEAYDTHHMFDVHDPGGRRVIVHHNTFESTDSTAVEFNDGPSDRGVIAHNWFYHDDEPGGCGDNPLAWNLEGSACDAVEVRENHYGSSEPADTIGAPRGGSGDSYDHHLVYEVSNGYADVSVTFDGEPVRGDHADSGDTITDNGDGTWTVFSEHLGNDYRDSWEYDGSVVDYAIDKPYDDDGTVTVWRDGTETTFEELVDDDVDSAAVVEDFERSDPLAEYGGATDGFGVTTAPVYEGTQALVNDGGAFGSAVSTVGLGDYPERGDRIEYYFDNAADDNFVAVHLFAQSEVDSPDGYSVGISNDGAWRLWRQVDGDLTTIANQDLPAADQIDGWYRAEIWTDDTTVYADLYDDATDALLASIQADDTTYASGGIGFRSAGNGETWDYVVRDVVEDFERSDPLAEYGGATDGFGVETSTVYEGTQALVNDGGNFGSAVSTVGLGDYPERGDEVHCFFSNAADDNFVALHLFAQSEVDSPDGYSVGISNDGAWRLWRQVDGSLTTIANQDLPTSDQISGWYRAEIRSDSSTVYADLYDDATDALLASIQADDTTFSSGGIGFRSAGNGEVWDFVRR